MYSIYVVAHVASLADVDLTPFFFLFFFPHILWGHNTNFLTKFIVLKDGKSNDWLTYSSLKQDSSWCTYVMISSLV